MAYHLYAQLFLRCTSLQARHHIGLNILYLFEELTTLIFVVCEEFV